MTRWMSGAGAALAALLPVMAAAQQACPTGRATDGVWFQFQDRTVLTRVLSTGRNLEIEFMGEETNEVHGFETIPLGLATESWFLSAGLVPTGERKTATFSGLPDPAPVPAPGMRFDGVETARYDDGTTETQGFTLVVGNAQPVFIGACGYTGLPIDVTWQPVGGEPPHIEAMMYLPDLGVTIYLGFTTDGSRPVPSMPLSVSTQPPLASAVPLPPPGPAPQPTK
ncbi:hypothetical protein [Roseicyclus sp.]|uniref:hypothetical protein n=1 Tax=Roseicyclus sp. TaxID=1914329 RepID=UPI003F9EF6EA